MFPSDSAAPLIYGSDETNLSGSSNTKSLIKTFPEYFNANPLPAKLTIKKLTSPSLIFEKAKSSKFTI